MARAGHLGGRAKTGVKVVIAGGNGSLGRRIVDDLTALGHEVVVLSRAVPDAASSARYVQWDGRTVGAWTAELEGPATAVINLAGKLVDCRPTDANIEELRRSRIESTRALVEASQWRPNPLRHWIQASTTAIWSDAGETRCDEETPIPWGLPQMTGVARPWEQAFDGANTSHGVILRTSIVLDRESLALRKLMTLTKLGLGGRVGDAGNGFRGSTSPTGWPSSAPASTSNPACRSRRVCWSRRRTTRCAIVN